MCVVLLFWEERLKRALLFQLKSREQVHGRVSLITGIGSELSYLMCVVLFSLPTVFLVGILSNTQHAHMEKSVPVESAEILRRGVEALGIWGNAAGCWPPPTSHGTA